MFENFAKWRPRLEAIGIFLVLLFIVIVAIPTFRDDTDKPKLVNVDTKETVFQKTLSETFVIGVLVAGLLPILYLASKEEEIQVPRRRSIVQAWSDIPSEERIKLGLAHIYDKQFNQSILYPIDDTYSMLRYPVYSEGKFYYVTIDMKDDWKKRSTTPIYSFAKTNIGVDRAKSLLGKKTDPLGRVLSQVEQWVGLPPEELKKKIAEERLRVEQERRRSSPGGLNEEV